MLGDPELTEPILSQFDVLCVVKDNCDRVVDELLICRAEK
ncbi:hypothetical protein VP01_1313g3 [Puccinia sorghi]|uniref:Minichromosome maintenance protein 2 n=1 Tax=Puccinia sorghi TaxID=27349 RepID=A0A0L6VMT8_9BASI|nr:hypothetical protein VP01_1313g3 [Puccinia sorghi]